MYVHEISIEIKSNYNKRELEIQLDHLMHYYRGSGQSLGRYECGYIDKNRMVSIPVKWQINDINLKVGENLLPYGLTEKSTTRI